MSKDAPIDVSIVKGRLVISIGINCLANAIEMHPTDSDCLYPKVTNPEVFARELCHELERESEDGSTAVQRMLDEAAEKAIQQGAEGVVVSS